MVLLLDVDFLPAEELSRIFSGRQEYQSTLVYLYNNAVIVLPAFETLQGAAEGQSLALQLAKGALQPSLLVAWLLHDSQLSSSVIVIICVADLSFMTLLAALQHLLSIFAARAVTAFPLVRVFRYSYASVHV